jgi:hypothetical protein
LVFASIVEAQHAVAMADRAYPGGLTFRDLVPAVVVAAIGAFLLIKTDWVVRVVNRAGDGAALPSLDADRLAVPAFSLAGAVFMVSGLASLASLAAYTLVPGNSVLSGPSAQTVVSNAIFYLVKLILGLCLFVGSRQIIALAKRLRPMPVQTPGGEA